jgi:hypothetical protein
VAVGAIGGLLRYIEGRHADRRFARALGLGALRFGVDCYTEKVIEFMPPQDRNHPGSIIKAVKSHQGLLVLLSDDEPGSEVFWLLDMTAKELERWWQDREDFWWPIDPEEDKRLAPILGLEPRPARPRMVLPGTFLGVGVPDRDDEQLLTQFWDSLYNLKRYHYGRLCCNVDSFLHTPDGRRIYHKGYEDTPKS